MSAKENQVERVAPAPTETALSVIRCPHMEWGELVEDTAVRDRPLLDSFGPCADPDTVGLREVTFRGDLYWSRLTISPNAFFHCTLQLGAMALADKVDAMEVKGGVEEEAVVLQLLSASAAEGKKLLTFGECSDCDGPFLVRDRH
jgi:hypothetical protein